MRTTQDVAGVCHPALELAEIGDLLTGMTLERRAVLPKAPNGQPIAPHLPGVANIRREMHAGRSQEWKRLMSVDVCDLAQGVPLALVLAPHYRAIAELKARHARQHLRGFGSLVRAEQKIAGTRVAAEMRVLETPANETALRTVVQTCASEREVLEQIGAEAERELVLLRTSARRVVAGRRASVQVMA